MSAARMNRYNAKLAEQGLTRITIKVPIPEVESFRQLEKALIENPGAMFTYALHRDPGETHQRKVKAK